LNAIWVRLTLNAQGGTGMGIHSTVSAEADHPGLAAFGGQLKAA
jgi:hypothetical protein|tara:strand:- start:217 stop:348 length:132 start_codon:yes stop_codon:yes gene_type:complete